MTSHKIFTLSEFLHESGAKYRVFDMGRRIVPLTPDEFIGFEWAKKPYPYPFKQAALFGVIFWDPKKSDQHYVWFLNFPLDEQGLLKQAARDGFLKMLLERVGECMLAAENDQQIQGALQDSPYSFSPRQEKMAAFNAMATKNLGLPPSSHYDDALAYFSGEKPLNEWQSLAMQGVADVAMRLDEREETASLIETIPRLSDKMFTAFSSYLEHAQPAIGIVEELVQRVEKELQESDPNITRICACLRAASNSPATGLVDHMVMHVLKHDCSNNVEILATIVGRIWRVLTDETICQLFVERLAKNDAGQAAFSQLLADAMFIPGLRIHIMQALRSSGRSEQLSHAVGEMFGQ
jgi:hypothetical protein